MAFDRTEWDKQNYRKRTEALHELLGGRCVKCSATQNLHMHHTNPDSKRFTITKSLSRSWQATLDELEGCELLCKDCHRQFHATTHGKLRMYNNGCRCDECRSVWNEKCKVYRKRYRAKLRARAVQSQLSDG